MGTNYSPYAMLFALMAFLWSVLTYFKVESVVADQKEVIELIHTFLNPQVELPEGEEI